MKELPRDLLSDAHASSIPDELREAVNARLRLQAALEPPAGAIRESGAQIAADELPDVRVRESRLAQALQNVLGNAIK